MILKSRSASFSIGIVVFLCICQLFALVVIPYFRRRSFVEVQGHVEPRFGYVKKAFESNFLDGYERDGANVAVFHRGRAVVDLWAGDADSKRGIPWTARTRTLLFSATKPLSALCIAILVDRGIIDWDDPVVKHWPAYGKNGKEHTTIRHILDHQAGVPYLVDEITYDDVLHSERVLKKIEDAAPVWTPGTASGYHALTYGWLIDGIIRGADPQHRDLATFFDEEIAQKLDLDVSIGLLNDADYNRSAFLTQPDPVDWLRDLIIDPRVLLMMTVYYAQNSDSVMSRIEKNPDWLSFENLTFNNLEVQRLKMGASNGLGTAHDVAKLFSIFLNGSIISPELVNKMSKPTLDDWHWEKTVFYPLMKGHGFFYDYHPQKRDQYVFGHPGYGCQTLHIDAANDLVVMYLSNGLKSATSHLCRPYQRILRNVYHSLGL